MGWNELNRLKVINTGENLGCYLYDAEGERTLKYDASYLALDINGQVYWEGYQSDRQVLYASPYLVFDNTGYTKHYYAGDERIASVIGGGFQGAGYSLFDLEYGFEVEDSMDYVAKKMGAEEMMLHDIDSLGLPPNFMLYDFLSKQILPLSEANNTESLVYFYHPDHLGSSTFISDANGLATQHLEYFPYGETFVEENVGSFDTRYKFTAKELDEFTGLYYYGARYYDPRTSVWLGVDPLSDKGPNISPYAYCSDNPIMRIDPSGALDDDLTAKLDGSIEIRKTDDSFDRFFVENKDNSINQVAQLDKFKASDGKTNLVNFPASGEGFTSYGEADPGGDHSVQPVVAAALFGAINENNSNGGPKLQFGDMSTSTGGKPGSEHNGGSLSHVNGRNVDMRLIRTDGASIGTNVNSPGFDKKTTQSVVNSLNKFGFKSILSNRNADGFLLKNTTSDPKGHHFDHLHLQGFKPSINYVK